MIPVKICGITNLTDARICIEHGVTALGFIFADSKRQVTVETVSRIARQLPPFVTKVGVFVDEDPLIIKEILKDCRLDLAQLHGNEEIGDAEILDGRVVKAFRAGETKPDLSWRNAPIRAVLVDSYLPMVVGGTGQVFDWGLFEAYRALGLPLILAGGLNPDNIMEAIRTARPDAVDLSSGVEREPGVKAPEKIRVLMSQIQ